MTFIIFSYFNSSIAAGKKEKERNREVKIHITDMNIKINCKISVSIKNLYSWHSYTIYHFNFPIATQIK